MELTEAAALLRHPVFDTGKSQHWADLGCGSGTFTLALASLLPAGSRIEAMDVDATALKSIPAQYNQTNIHTKKGNFTERLPYRQLDGILMANSLHYVARQEEFIHQAAGYLRPGGHFLIVEYDITRANQWVPYPLRFSHLPLVFASAGFTSVTKIAQRPSRYQGTMYAALVGYQQTG